MIFYDNRRLYNSSQIHFSQFSKYYIIKYKLCDVSLKNLKDSFD